MPLLKTCIVNILKVDLLSADLMWLNISQAPHVHYYYTEYSLYIEMSGLCFGNISNKPCRKNHFHLKEWKGENLTKQQNQSIVFSSSRSVEVVVVLVIASFILLLLHFHPSGAGVCLKEMCSLTVINGKNILCTNFSPYVQLYCVCVCVTSQGLQREVCDSRGWVITVDSNPTDGLAARISRSGGVVSQYGPAALLHPRRKVWWTLSPPQWWRYMRCTVVIKQLSYRDIQEPIWQR